MSIGIVGLGLIGTSVTLAARRAWPDVRLIGVDRAEIVRHPRLLEALTIGSTDLAAVSECDLIVLAMPVDAIVETVARLPPLVQEDTVVVDTGSTKRTILRAARDAGCRGFVGGHPLAGAATSGPVAARADLFDQRPWFLVSPPGAALERARRFVEDLGAYGIAMHDDGTEHDQLMAAVSHLPQVVSSALMARVGKALGESGLRHVGAGLRDTTRLASSPASVWESVLASNADQLRPLLLQLADDLREIAGRLDDRDAVRRLFDAAKRWKEQT